MKSAGPDACDLPIKALPDGVELMVKVVPGASRTRIAGLLGDRLKIAVSAPPEGGKANAAVCELLARTLGVPAREVSVIAGHTQPAKRVQALGVTLCAAVERLRRELK